MTKHTKEKFIEYIMQDFIFHPNRETLEKKFADELARQKKEIIEELKKMKIKGLKAETICNACDGHIAAGECDCRATNRTLDQAIKTISKI